MSYRVALLVLYVDSSTEVVHVQDINIDLKAQGIDVVVLGNQKDIIIFPKADGVEAFLI